MTESYGASIRRLREERGWNQDELLKRAQVSRDTLSRAENSGNVGVLLLYQIADALDVNINAFFGGAQPKSELPPFEWWSRLKREQRARVERYARRLLGEAMGPPTANE